MQAPTIPASSPEQSLRTLQGDREDLRAMKRALARAPLGPVATLALTNAILSLEDALEPPLAQGRIAADS